MNPHPSHNPMKGPRLWHRLLGALSTFVPGIAFGTLLANQDPTVTIIPKTALADLATPAVVAFEFDATDPDGQVAAVDVFDNGGWIASLTNRPFQIQREWWAGGHQLLARARDNQGGTGFSSAVPFTVKAPSPVALKPVRRDGNDLVLEWSGGNGPFLVELQSDLRDTWTILGSTGSNRVARVPLSATHRFLQINDTAISGTRNYDATLSAGQVRPAPVDSKATAGALMSLYHSTVTFRIEYSGLASSLAAVRIHGPSTTNDLAAPLIDLLPFHEGPTGTSGVLAGSLVLTPEQKLAFVGGQTYLTVVEAGKTTETLRGQLLPRPLGYEKDHDEDFTFDVLNSSGSSYNTSNWRFEFGDPVVTSGQNPHNNRPWVTGNSGGKITFRLTCGRKSDSWIADEYRAAGFGYSDLNKEFPNKIAAHLHADGGTQIPSDLNFFFPVKVTTESGITLQMYLGQHGTGKGWKGDLEAVGEAAKEGYDVFKDLEGGKIWSSLKDFRKFLDDLAKLGSENSWSVIVVGTLLDPAFIADLEYRQSPYPATYTTSQLICGGPTSTGLKQLFQIQPKVPFPDPSRMSIYVQGPR